MSISPMLLGIRNTAITTQHKSLGQEKGVKKCINQEKKTPNNTIFYVAYLVASIRRPIKKTNLGYCNFFLSLKSKDICCLL